MPHSLIRYAWQSGSSCLAALDDFGTVLWTVSETPLAKHDPYDRVWYGPQERQSLNPVWTKFGPSLDKV